MLIPGQTVSFSSLLRMGYDRKRIRGMQLSFALFPTPFKGIYYVPFDSERKAKSMGDPLKVLTMAIRLYLGTDQFYYTCRTAEEWHGIEWHPSGLVHVANGKLSRRIDIERRAELRRKGKTYYSRHVSSVLSQYGRAIIFHRSAGIASAKYVLTPSGRFATKRQLARDKSMGMCGRAER